MAGKLILTWDISPEREQEYFEFVVREFLPEVQQMGFQVSDAWVTVYGQQPQILVGAVMPTVKKVNETIYGEAWGRLVSKLLDYVVNFEYKVVPAHNGFQF